tara:strand:+ start:256 stop:711 length:456 start_codon:yes stop_codon:yes gene_type:complete
MITCPICRHSENENDQFFCNECGSSLEGNKDTNLVHTGLTITENGKLIFPDKSSYEIDHSQRSIGRADLEKFTKEDSNLISRSHFTIYKSKQKYFIRNGFTNVQNKPSPNKTTILESPDNATIVLGSDGAEIELQTGNKILVSDIELSFVV